MAGRTSTPAAREALECLCRAYWQPVYLYLRTRADGVGEAEDLTQEFFSRLLSSQSLAQVDPSKGRFRSFLFAAMNHFLSNERDRVHALKRGGRTKFLSLAEISVEEDFAREPATHLTPERLFERRWATALLAQVFTRLRSEFDVDGSSRCFDELKSFLVGERNGASYATLAGRLRTTEAALKMRVQRLRQRYGEMLREEIARTVAEPGEIADEQRHLLAVLSE